MKWDKLRGKSSSNMDTPIFDSRQNDLQKLISYESRKKRNKSKEKSVIHSKILELENTIEKEGTAVLRRSKDYQTLNESMSRREN